MAKPHAPAFSGPQINIPEGSRGSVNESTPMEQRVPNRMQEVSEGPNRQKFGNLTTYGPARYEQTQVVENRRGEPIEHKIIREDR